MKKQRSRPQLTFDPVTGYTEEDVARGAVDKHGEDDKRWKREQRNKRKKVDPAPVPDGPCCLRCRHWIAPMDREKTGICRRLAYIGRKVPGMYAQPPNMEGRVVIWREERDIRGYSTEPLHTGPGFLCSGERLCPIDGYEAKEVA